MNRREFIAGLGSAAVWPLAAQAQQPTMPVIGVLILADPDSFRVFDTAFRRGLSEIGYVEGRNVAIEYRWPGRDPARLSEMADDLVRRGVAVIVAASTPTAVAAQTATKSIPIVLSIAADPVEAGFVASLNRPGGNLTGISNLGTSLTPKRLQILHDLLPAAPSLALLINPTNQIEAERETREVELAAQSLGVRLLILNASRESEFEAAVLTVVRERAAGLVVGADPLFYKPDQLIALAARHQVPTIYRVPEAAVAGGLMSYGTDFPDSFRQVGVYAGRILKGEKPADMPVSQVTKMQLVVNMKTAKALGLSIPLALVVRADEVIE
jgi:putative tryptophan/tyrosine transport system substrate-binding protein